MTREDADLVTCVLAITCQALRQSGEECAAGLALLSMVLCTAAADQVAPMLVVMTAEMTRSVGSTSSCHLDTILRPMRQLGAVILSSQCSLSEPPMAHTRLVTKVSHDTLMMTPVHHGHGADQGLVPLVIPSSHSSSAAAHHGGQSG